jgi:TatA/E family protein of Tat protein translocase
MNGLALLAWTPFDPMHLLVIMAVALLLFGKRLPEVGRSLGRGISEFKKGLKDVGEELNRDDDDKDRRRLPDDSTRRPPSSQQIPGPQEPKGPDPYDPGPPT